MAFSMARKVEIKNMVMNTKRFPSNAYRESNAPSSNLPKPTRLTPQQMNERREKGLCFNCDSKYHKGHKCCEKKLFYIDCEENEEKEQETPVQKEKEILKEKEKETSKEITPTISWNAFVGITTPQTLKIEGYIKKKKVIVLIDSSSTHNFIHSKIAKDLNCFIYLALEFQVIVADGETIKCSGKCHNIKLSMEGYVLNIPMISIPMGVTDVVLEIFMRFLWEGN
jgi:uncharacterized membrane protein